ncbi:MAG: hypothetical protein ACT4PV_09355 [Planctomycetaceae bacterium]
MRRLMVALGAFALAALLVARNDAGRDPARGAREVTRGSLAAPANEADKGIEDAASPDAEARLPEATLAPGEVAVRILEVDAHRPVADLEVAIRDSCPPARTNGDGIVTWGAVAPGDAQVSFPDGRWRVVGEDSFRAELVTRPLTVWAERLTTLRLRFEHEDGTPVGVVAQEVTCEERAIRDDPRQHDWTICTGSDVRIFAACEDGYEAAARFTSDGWPVDELTIRMREAAPRGHARLRVQVVGIDGEPLAGAGVTYVHEFGGTLREEIVAEKGGLAILDDVSAAGRSVTGTSRRKSVADKEGIAILDDLPTAGRGLAIAWARGRRAASVSVTLEPGSTRLLCCPLEPRAGLSIRGICPDRPKAVIRLDNTAGNRAWVTELLRGEFDFDDLDPGDYTVTARDGDDVVTATAVAGGPPVRLEFPPLGTLALDCRDAQGRVPESIDVVLEREGVRAKGYGATAEGGLFRVRVSQGPVRFHVKAGSYQDTPFVPAHVFGDTITEVSVPLGEPQPILDVLVVDPNGEPVPGVYVVAWSWSDAGAFLWNDEPCAKTQLDGWARFFFWRSEEVQLAVCSRHPGGIGDSPEPSGPVLRVPETGRVTATRVVVPRLLVRQLSEPLPAPLLDGDELVEWDGWRLRLEAELPRRWTEPKAVKVRRAGKMVELTLPPMRREFLVWQALQP